VHWVIYTALTDCRGAIRSAMDVITLMHVSVIFTFRFRAAMTEIDAVPVQL